MRTERIVLEHLLSNCIGQANAESSRMIAKRLNMDVDAVNLAIGTLRDGGEDIVSNFYGHFIDDGLDEPADMPTVVAVYDYYKQDG